MAKKHSADWTRTDIVRYHRYGMTKKQYESRLEEQGGVCAVCLGGRGDGKGDVFYVDHDHTTGEIRGLVCPSCNAVLRGAQDNPNNVKRLADRVAAYLGWSRGHSPLEDEWFDALP